MVFGNGRLGNIFVMGGAMLVLTAAHPGAHPKAVPVSGADGSSIPASTATAVGTVTAFHAALRRGDTDGAFTLLAEDALIFESGGVERSRAEYAAHHLKADATFSAAVRRDLVDRSSGEDGHTAWVMSVETVKGNYLGRAINSRSVETMILRRLNNDWRIAHIHWSSAAS